MGSEDCQLGSEHTCLNHIFFCIFLLGRRVRCLYGTLMLGVQIPSPALFPSDKVLYNKKSIIFISGQESNE